MPLKLINDNGPRLRGAMGIMRAIYNDTNQAVEQGKKFQSIKRFSVLNPNTVSNTASIRDRFNPWNGY